MLSVYNEHGPLMRLGSGPIVDKRSPQSADAHLLPGLGATSRELLPDGLVTPSALSPPQIHVANVGLAHDFGKLLRLNDKHIRDVSPVEQLAGEAQVVSPCPCLDKDYPKTILWSKIEDLEDVCHESHDEARPWPVCDNDMGVLEPLGVGCAGTLGRYRRQSHQDIERAPQRGVD